MSNSFIWITAPSGRSLFGLQTLDVGAEHSLTKKQQEMTLKYPWGSGEWRRLIPQLEDIKTNVDVLHLYGEPISSRGFYNPRIAHADGTAFQSG